MMPFVLTVKQKSRKAALQIIMKPKSNITKQWRTTVRTSHALHMQLVRFVAERTNDDPSYPGQEWAIVKAIEAYVSNPSTTDEVGKNPVAEVHDSAYTVGSPAIDQWVRKLVQILKSGHTKAIRAVLTNLEAFDRLSEVDIQEARESADRSVSAEDKNLAAAVRELRRLAKRVEGGEEDSQGGGTKTA